MLFDLSKQPKKAFPFYASTLDALEELPEERQGEVALTLLDFAFRDDVTAPFECSDHDWIVLSQVFEGIVTEKRRYQIGMRLEEVIRTLKQRVKPISKDKASIDDMVEKLEDLRTFVRENSSEVDEVDILNILGTQVYSEVAEPVLLRPALLAEFRNRIATAPQEQRIKLEKALDDLVDFCQQLSPVSSTGTQQSGSASAPIPTSRSAVQSGDGQSPSQPFQGKYGFCLRTAPKSETSKTIQPDSKPFIPNDLDEAVLAKAPTPSLFDIDGFGESNPTPLNLRKGDKR